MTVEPEILNLEMIYHTYITGGYNELRNSVSRGTIIQLINRAMENEQNAAQIDNTFNTIGLYYLKQREIHTIDETSQDAEERYTKVQEAVAIKNTISTDKRKILVI
jgi:hypothetical protein